MASREVKLILQKETLRFARYTITDRAIPSVEDGLKTAQRRTIYSMNENGFTHDRLRTKSIDASSSVTDYTPHGDSSIYELIVRFANDSILYNLIDGKGAFSTITSKESPGAPRYTEVRLSEYAEELLEGFNENGSIMIDNYKETKKEPLNLPSKSPNILLNSNKGISMGIATNIPSYNMHDLFENIRRVVAGENTKIMYPDFATGGQVIRDRDEAKSVKETGRGKYKLRGTYTVKDNIISIDSVPYGETVEDIIVKIRNLVNNKKLSGVTAISDATGSEGLEIAITLKKNADPDEVMAIIYDKTPLEANFSCNMWVLYDNKPHLWGTDDIIKGWLSYRNGVINKITKYRLEKVKSKLNTLYGYSKIIDNLDKTVNVIRESNSDNVITNLQKEIKLDENQAKKISDIKLVNLNKTWIKNQLDKIADLEAQESEYKNIIDDEDAINNIILSELDELEDKYGKERKTKVISPKDIVIYEEPTKEDLVEDYNVKVYITKDNYIKKVPLTSLRGDYVIKTKTNDEIISETDATNKDELLVFTTNQKVYKKRLYELDDDKPSTLGSYMPSEINLEDDDEILYATILKEGEPQYLIIGFDNGKVAKIDLSAYATKQNRKQVKNAYNKKHTPVFFKAITEDIDLLAQSSDSRTVLLSTGVVNSKSSKASQGNQFIKLKDTCVASYKEPEEEIGYEYYRVKSASVGKLFK